MRHTLRLRLRWRLNCFHHEESFHFKRVAGEVTVLRTRRVFHAELCNCGYPGFIGSRACQELADFIEGDRTVMVVCESRLRYKTESRRRYAGFVIESGHVGA